MGISKKKQDVHYVCFVKTGIRYLVIAVRDRAIGAVWDCMSLGTIL